MNIVEKLDKILDIKYDLSTVIDDKNIKLTESFETYPNTLSQVLNDYDNDNFTRIKISIDSDNYELKIAEVDPNASITIYKTALVKWGDGSSDTFESTIEQISHIYEKAGIYEIRINDALSNIILNDYKNITFNYQDVEILNSYPSMSCIIDIKYSKLIREHKDRLFACEFANTQLTSIDFINDLVFTKDNYTRKGGQFSHCKKLEKVNLSGLTNTNYSRYEGMFSYCDSLIDVKLENIDSIPNEMFYLCGKLSSVYAPIAESIGLYSFSNCSSLTEISLPKAKTLVNRGFWQCTKLSSINMPELTSIGVWGFFSCTALSTVEFQKVEIISGDKNFRACSNLRKLKFNALSSISGIGPFSNCSKLELIDMSDNDNFVQINNGDVFSEMNSTSKFLVKEELLNQYLADPNWQLLPNYQTRIVSSLN